jgi:hypothetical protein
MPHFSAASNAAAAIAGFLVFIWRIPHHDHFNNRPNCCNENCRTRNRTKDRIGAALALLLKRGEAKGEMQTTGGRAAEIWFALNPQATK